MRFFDIPKNNAILLKCACGRTTLRISNTKSGYQLDIPCFFCGEVHTKKMTTGQFWNNTIFLETCPNSDYDIFAVGDCKTVTAWEQQYDAVLSDFYGLESESYFENPTVLFEIMQILEKLDEEGKIHCPCGTHEIEMELSSDKITIICENCHNRAILYARDTADLEALKGLSAITLKKPGKRLHLVKK